MSKKRVVIIAVLIIAVVLIITAGKNVLIKGNPKSQMAAAEKSNNKIAVKVQKVEASEVASNTSYKADLEASEEGIVSNKVGGKVLQIMFDDGAKVSKGQALVKLDDTDIRNSLESSEAQLESAKIQLKSIENQLSSAQIGLQNAQTTLSNAQKNYDRTKSLYASGGVSEVDLESDETVLKNAKSGYQTTKISVDSASLSVQAQKSSIKTAMANLDALKTSLISTTITAPISGIISGKNVNVGQYINMGSNLATVNNISQVTAVIDLKQEDLNSIKVGQKAQFKLSDDDKTSYAGTVSSIDVAADTSTRVFKCKIRVGNENNELKPGIVGTAYISSSTKRKAIMLPLDVLGGSEGDYYVFVDLNGSAVKRTVTTGQLTKDMVEITSGLNTGESVVTTNVGSLVDGEAVVAAD